MKIVGSPLRRELRAIVKITYHFSISASGDLWPILIRGETPGKWGVFGIGFVVAGCYALHGTKVRHGYLAPLRAIFKEPGSWLMLIVSLIYSILAVLGKKAIEHSSPLFFAFFFLAALDFVILSFFPFLGKIRWAALLRMPAKGIRVGFMLYLHLLFHALAISMVQAVYMISVKRMSILFAVVYGWLFGDRLS